MIDEKKLIEDIRKCDRYVIELGEEKTLVDVVRLDDVKRTINRQPKADWIPCEIEMPKEEYGTYWIAVEVEKDKPYYYCSAVWTSKDGFRTQDIEAQGKIVAWQPIQLYKKEGAE